MLLAIALLPLIFKLAIVGLILWLIFTYIPMPEVVKKILYVIVAIAAIVFLAQLLGVDLGLNLTL